MFNSKTKQTNPNKKFVTYAISENSYLPTHMQSNQKLPQPLIYTVIFFASYILVVESIGPE